jgi:hypothetical protein
MMKQHRHLPVFIAALLICCVVPVSAAILEVTFKGEVSAVTASKNTIAIKNPAQYGCNYPASGAPVCSWTPIDKSTLTGTVPDASAVSLFKAGDYAVATSLGGAGDQWITLAKIYGQKETEQLITDIVGDPRTVPLPLIGDYSVDTETVPDCGACTGTVCTAKQAKVTIKSGGSAVADKTLAAGESFTFNGRNDGSAVMVKFVSGQAASQSCPGKAGMTGPQAISVFEIHVTPPVGTGQVDIRTATTTRRDEALTPLPATTAAPAASPTKAGALLPFSVLAGLCGAVLFFSRK